MASSDSSSKAPASSSDSLRETLESIIIAFVLAFVFRAYVVEAFVIPTGSMAPTLLGEHIQLTCDQCGYPYTFDLKDEYRLTRKGNGTGRSVVVRTSAVTTLQPLISVCPMCHNPNAVMPGTRVSSGDRILVHKYIYTFANPRRWDVVVFKNPQDPTQNYIKRLIGLPEESLQIIEGNIYVKPAAGGDWRIARKTHRDGDGPDALPRVRVQQAVWQAVYHSQYLPLDGGDRVEAGYRWHVPWQAESDEKAWTINGQRSYQHQGKAPGEIRFTFPQLPRDPQQAYNQQRVKEDSPVEDVRLACAVQPLEPGLNLTLQTTARWAQSQPDADRSVLRATLASDGRISLVRGAGGGQPESVLATGSITPLPVGVATQVELWHVDQELSLWVAGRCVLHVAYELPMAMLRSREPVSEMQPDLRLQVSGASATLHRVEVDRDLYYLSGQYPGEAMLRAGLPGLGVLMKPRTGEAVGEPAVLESDQFFCLGDNSPLSSDGRYWWHVNPWIRSRYLSNHTLQTGIVPRELMMGRAFFVYFPAPHNLNPQSVQFIPNFGQMRFIH